MVEVYKTNTVGPFLCTRAFLPLLLKKQKRVIVNVSSRLASIVDKVDILHGRPLPAELPHLPEFTAGHGLAYSCSKAAVNMGMCPTVSVLAPP